MADDASGTGDVDIEDGLEFVVGDFPELLVGVDDGGVIDE